MRIREYRSQFIDALSPVYDLIEAESFFYLILEEKKQLKRIDLALQPDLQFTVEEMGEWNALLDSLLREVPVQYLLGKTHFYGLEFEVNPNVLIPRQETEELVDWIIKSCRAFDKNKKLKILDIGTGSGCIAISLAKNISSAQVFALDVSPKAVATARQNALNNAVDIQFIEQNILETQDLEQTFDIIVSNPPYVRELEKVEIKKNVLDHEPHLALFVEDTDPLLFYRKIAQLALKNLNASGQLYFEINQYLGKDMVSLLQELTYKNILLQKDIYNNDRMIKAELDSQ